mmetsp:Transcript_4270/g.8793  ORF Transcript_4270/g.8793 Transcript_4270/m.8793 type:complete len:187 (-) Transcript_4270:82-642(-)|eukprot:CAMPEP_0118956242 /NCGR_PEP_ID=MMETSP1169-20130426/61376_1 /TAXON_ID=36882 /ORGANISM="Pyramimonas obovata, Strain CCMP722" /LENGTH=186 /DNA_ID=CAMNT_0006904235 /DNA_START=71 /DNA_END=631 /DNA_ORIENTATION=+
MANSTCRSVYDEKMEKENKYDPMFTPGKAPTFLGGLLVGEGHYIKETLPYLTMFPELNEKSPLMDPESPIVKSNKGATTSVRNFVTHKNAEYIAGGNRQRLVSHYHHKAEDGDFGEPKFEKIGSVGALSGKGSLQKFQAKDREIDDSCKGRRPVPPNPNKVSVWTLDHEIARERKREQMQSSPNIL